MEIIVGDIPEPITQLTFSWDAFRSRRDENYFPLMFAYHGLEVHLILLEPWDFMNQGLAAAPFGTATVYRVTQRIVESPSWTDLPHEERERFHAEIAKWNSDDLEARATERLQTHGMTEDGLIGLLNEVSETLSGIHDQIRAAVQIQKPERLRREIEQRQAELSALEAQPADSSGT